MLFLNICKQGGLTWLFADFPSEAKKATKGKPADLAAEISGRPVSLIAWNAEPKLAALSKLNVFGEILAVLSPVGDAPAAPYNALAVARAYYTVSPALLKLGVPAQPGDEQWYVVNLMLQGFNVKCVAVAGAGKSTTLKICASVTKSPVHLLTYNKRLQLEVARSSPKNMTAQTYHAAAGNAYGCVTRDNDAIVRCLRSGPPMTPPQFGHLFLDEAQDICPILHALTNELYTANPKAQMIVVGDTLQAINQYRGAHPGFLTDASELYAPRPRGQVPVPIRRWASCRLGISYRLTPATADFVNVHMYKAAVIVGGNTKAPNRKPLYIAASGGKAGCVSALIGAVRDAVKEFGPEHVFVLAPSVRNLASKSSPVAELVRSGLSGIPTFVGAGDGEKVDDDIIKGKLAVISINSSKGCERKCVIMAGLDETYFKFFEKEWQDPDRLPNLLTVGATRAREYLIIVASARDTLRTIDVTTLRDYATVKGKPSAGRAKKRRQTKSDHPISVEKLVRHLHPETIRAAMQFVSVSKLAPTAYRSGCAAPTVDARARFGDGETSDYVEDLRFVYSALAPVTAAVARTGATQFGEGLDQPEVVESASELRDDKLQIVQADYDAYPESFWEELSLACSSPAADRTAMEWARIAVAARAIRDGRHHTARQVLGYDWVDGNALDAIRDVVLKALEGIDGDFEVHLTSDELVKSTTETKRDLPSDIPEIYGQAHFVSGAGEVWEFKLDELCEENELYLACLLALRGGGEGVLMSLLHHDTRRVEVEDAAMLIATLSAGKAPETRTAAEMVEAFRAGEHFPTDEFVDERPEAQSSQFDLDDAFDED